MTELLLKVKTRALSQYSNILFARPSLIEGAARIADLSGTLNVYSESDSPQAADYNALWADWCQVGFELREGMNQHAGAV